MRKNHFLALASLLVVAAVQGTAATILDVSLNTSSLTGNPAGPFTINFQLTNGDGVTNNIVTIGPFSFGGGAPGGNPGSFGDVTGDLSGVIVLSDTSFFNDFVEDFTPGAAFRFTVCLPTNSPDTGIPDRFTFAVLDGMGFEIPTTGPGNALLGVDLRAPHVFETYRSNLELTTVDLGPPSIGEVPEPASMTLVALALGVLGTLRRRARR